MSGNGKKRILLVANNGGHLLQLHTLSTVWKDYDRAWVTGPKSDANSMLRGEEVHYAHQPTDRNLGNLVRNFVLAFGVAKKVRPDWVISTGAAMALPFMVVGKLFGARLMFIESFAKLRTRTLTGRLVYPLCDEFFVQWEAMKELYPKARYCGTVYDDILDGRDA